MQIFKPDKDEKMPLFNLPKINLDKVTPFGKSKQEEVKVAPKVNYFANLASLRTMEKPVVVQNTIIEEKKDPVVEIKDEIAKVV